MSSIATSPINVLVIGSGGREHALTWALSQSPRLGQLHCAPGNAGIASVATCVDMGADAGSLIAFCRNHDIGLVVVGPEAPLVDGLVDALDAEGIPAFGPTRAAARLEGSKGFTKDLCARHNIPTAAYARFDNADAACAYAHQQWEKSPAALVIKADGLAAGKGVIIAGSLTETLDAIATMFAGAFGEAGTEVVIEDFLVGEEASFFALVDGRTVLPLATAQDHKRAGDGDTGPNTGGMGAYSPAPVMTDVMVRATMERIVRPTVDAMAAEGCPFKGVLYAGLMLTENGPELIEYNVRFGDPECQVLMMRLASDILPALLAAATGTLDAVSLDWRDEVALTVVMATRGYPGAYGKGSEICGLDAAGAVEGVQIFHAGTRSEDGRILANGGRVLNVTARGRTVREAQARAYDAVDRIDWADGFCRRDIGWRAAGREREKQEMENAS